MASRERVAGWWRWSACHVLGLTTTASNWRQASVPVSFRPSPSTSRRRPPAGQWATTASSCTVPGRGRSWKRQRDGRPDAADTPLLDVWFEDAKSGWAVGAFGLLLRTREAAPTGNRCPSCADNPKNMHLYAVRGIGDDLYIAGEQGVLLKLDRPSGRFRAIERQFYKGTLFGLAGTGRVCRRTGCAATCCAAPTAARLAGRGTWDCRSA